MLEKEFFSQQRHKHLIMYPDLAMTEKWGNYCLIPLDIPTINNSKLVEWFFKTSKPAYKISADIANNYTNVTSFDTIDVMPTNQENKDQIWTLNIQQDFITKFKDVYDQIMAYFPFKSISHIRFWSSTTNIHFHRDQTKFIDYPGAFRIMLYDENPIQSLALINSFPDTEDNLEEKFFLPRLSTTNSYVWNNLRIKHGSFFIPGFRKIIIILDLYEIDLKKYEDLINRSINKYKEKCVISTNNIEDYISLN